MAQLDLNLVRLFVAIYESRSVSTAARTLNLTQPTVSYGLSKLRSVLQDQLFVRQREGMIPTGRADLIYGDFVTSLRRIQKAVDDAQDFDPSRTTRRFVLAMSDIGEMIFLPPVLEALHKEAPNAELEVQPLSQGDLSRRLATGELVAAVGNLPYLDNSGQPQAILFEETYVCLARRQNRLFTRVNNRDLFDEARHVHVASKASGHVLVEEALQNQGIRRKITLEIAHFAILSHVLARSDLVALVPSRVATLFKVYEDLESCPIPAPVPSYHVSLHWHENDRSNLANQWFRNLVRTALTNLG